jgi:hypothetical protein
MISVPLVECIEISLWVHNKYSKKSCIGVTKLLWDRFFERCYNIQVVLMDIIGQIS